MSIYSSDHEFPPMSSDPKALRAVAVKALQDALKTYDRLQLIYQGLYPEQQPFENLVGSWLSAEELNYICRLGIYSQLVKL
jgi:hypothetical protein